MDFLDLGTNDEKPVFNPPKPNAVGITMDGNQTIRLGGDDTIASGKLKPGIIKGPPGGVNDSANETIGGIMAMFKKEENDRKEHEEKIKSVCM